MPRLVPNPRLFTTPPPMADFDVTCFRVDDNAFFTLTWTDVPEPTAGKVIYLFGGSRSGIIIEQVPQGVGFTDVTVSNFSRGQVTFSAQAVYFFDDDDDNMWTLAKNTELQPLKSAPVPP